MTKNEYDDELELFKDLEEEITNVMQNEVDKEVKRIYKKNVDVMYDSYDRNYYEPRYDKGGFADTGNWRSEVNKNGDIFEYMLENETTGAMDSYGRRIDQIIETGIGYKWRGRPDARPVYTWTMEELEDSNVLETALEKGLKSKNWNVK